MKLIILGNSHLAYFWESFKKFEKIQKKYDIKFACSNFLKTGLDPKDTANFMRKFEYLNSVKYGDKTFPKPIMFENFSVSTEENVVIILVGLGLNGEAVYGIWGGFNNCVLPIEASKFPSLMDKNSGSIPMSSDLLKQIYTDYYLGKVEFLKSIVSRPNIRVEAWFSSPNLNENAAKYCFGEEHYNIGNASFHYEIQNQARKGVFEKVGFLNLVRDPNLSYCNKMHCLPEKFKLSDTNNHATAEFYEQEIKSLIRSKKLV